MPRSSGSTTTLTHITGSRSGCRRKRWTRASPQPYIHCAQKPKNLRSWLGARRGLARPADRRVVAVLAGIVPAHAVVGKSVALGAHGEHQFVGRNGMTGRTPSLAAGMRARQRLDRQMHDAGNLHPPRFAVDAVSDRDLLQAE